MPTVLEDGPYRFVFFSSDRGEPPHVHVKRDRQIAKFWLGPVVLAKNRGFSGHELNKINRLVVEHEATLLEAWREYFDS
jgi:predicted nucleotidyltransferase